MAKRTTLCSIQVDCRSPIPLTQLAVMPVQDSQLIPTTYVDAEEMSARFTYDGVVSRFRPLIGSGQLSAGLSFHQLPEVMFCESSYPNGAFAEIQGDGQRAVFVMPLCGNARVRWGSQALHSSATVGLAGDNALLEQVELFPERLHRMFTLDKALLVKALAAYADVPLPGHLSFQSEIDMTEGAGAMLAGFGNLFHMGLVAGDVLTQSTLAASNLTEALIAFTITALPHNFLYLHSQKVSIGANWQLRRAMDYMAAHAGRPIKMEDVASACNISVRALYRLFKERRSTTPRLFLHQMRLKAAHKEIADPYNRDTIAQIALRWGFHNMGEFAAQHYRAFGALPSDIRKKLRSFV